MVSCLFTVPIAICTLQDVGGKGASRKNKRQAQLMKYTAAAALLSGDEPEESSLPNKDSDVSDVGWTVRATVVPSVRACFLPYARVCTHAL